MEMYDSAYKGNSRAEIKNSSAPLFIPSSMIYSNQSGSIRSYNPAQAEFYMQKQMQRGQGQKQKQDYHLQKDVGAYKMPGVSLNISIPRTIVKFK